MTNFLCCKLFDTDTPRDLIVNAESTTPLPADTCTAEGYEQCLISINVCNTITVGRLPQSMGSTYSAFRSHYASVAAARGSLETPEDGLTAGDRLHI